MRTSKIRVNKNMIPVIFAAGLFLLSCVFTFLYLNSSEKQAERILKEIYSADLAWADAQVGNSLEDCYQENFGSLVTEKGMNALKQLKLPYGLMDKGKKVDKIYGNVITLKPVKEIIIGETAKSQNGKEKKIQAFTYEVKTEIYFNKGNEVMQTVETEGYAGTIYMEKTGWLNWQMDGLTGRRTQ